MPDWANKSGIKTNKNQTGTSYQVKPTGHISATKSAAKSTANNARDPQEIERHREAKLHAVEKRKARSRSVTMTVFVLLIMIFTVFIILRIMKQTAPKPQFMFIQKGVLEHTVGATGLLLRDEVLMRAMADGTVKPLIEEGSRVSYGQNIAIIIDKGAETSLTELKNCEQQISDLQRELINKGKGPGARVIYDETDKDIAELVNLVRKDSSNGVLSNMNSYETSISVLLERRNTRLLSIDFNDSRLTQLKIQKSNIEKDLGILTGTIKSKTSGIVSYHIDGLEEAYQVKDIQAFTPEQYKDFIHTSKPYVTTGESINKNDPIVRITSGIYQYIAFLLPDTQLSAFPVGSTHTLKMPLDGMTIKNCQVIKSISDGSDLFIIFQTDRQLDRFSDRRTIQADITTSSSEGMKIPFSSIIGFNEAQMTGEIMIVSKGYTRIAKIHIIDFNRNDAIIAGVKDEKYAPAVNGYLVENPASIKEGENIGGAK